MGLEPFPVPGTFLGRETRRSGQKRPGNVPDWEGNGPDWEGNGKVDLGTGEKRHWTSPPPRFEREKDFFFNTWNLKLKPSRLSFPQSLNSYLFPDSHLRSLLAAPAKASSYFPTSLEPRGSRFLHQHWPLNIQFLNRYVWVKIEIGFFYWGNPLLMSLEMGGERERVMRREEQCEKHAGVTFPFLLLFSFFDIYCNCCISIWTTPILVINSQ